MNQGHGRPQYDKSRREHSPRYNDSDRGETIPPIKFYSEDKILRSELFKSEAEEYAKRLRGVSKTKLRKFYDEFVNLDVKRVKLEQDNGTSIDRKKELHPKLMVPLMMQKAYAHYQVGRAQKKDEHTYRILKSFIEQLVSQIESNEDLKNAVRFFEAVYAYHRLCGDNE